MQNVPIPLDLGDYYNLQYTFVKIKFTFRIELKLDVPTLKLALFYFLNQQLEYAP